MNELRNLYNELKIDSNSVTNDQIMRLEDWVGKNVSSDFRSSQGDLSRKFRDYDEMVKEYFDRKNFAELDSNLLQFTITQGWDKFLELINPSAEQLNKVPNALQLAVAGGHLNTLKLLLSKGLTPPSPNSKILYITLLLPFTHSSRLKQKKEEVFNFLATKWPDLLLVNSDERGNIFHAMAENNYHQLISNYLTSHEKLVYVMNNLGQYPITCAILNRGYEAAKALLKIQAVSKLSDNKNRLPIHHAAFYSDKPMLELCLAADFSALNAKDKFGQTPLHLACIAENNNTVIALIEAEADVNQVDSYYERSALHYAAINNNQDLINALLQQNTRLINDKDVEGRTPLDYVTNNKIRELLISKGAVGTEKQLDDF